MAFFYMNFETDHLHSAQYTKSISAIFPDFFALFWKINHNNNKMGLKTIKMGMLGLMVVTWHDTDHHV